MLEDQPYQDSFWRFSQFTNLSKNSLSLLFISQNIHFLSKNHEKTPKSDNFYDLMIRDRDLLLASRCQSCKVEHAVSTFRPIKRLGPKAVLWLVYNSDWSKTMQILHDFLFPSRLFNLSFDNFYCWFLYSRYGAEIGKLTHQKFFQFCGLAVRSTPTG